MYEIIVIGAGPAGMEAAQRAAQLGAKTALVTKDYLGGMATNDGPVPVRTLAHAARLVREAKQLNRYGIASVEPAVDYPKLLQRVQEVVLEVHEALDVKGKLESKGVDIFEQAGLAHFINRHTIETESGLRVESKKFIICAGGQNRTLPIPGSEHTVTHSDAWSLSEIPRSMIVVGSGATGAQVASIFNAFGCQVSMFEVAPRILMTEDEDVSAAVARAYQRAGIAVYEGFDGIDSIEKLANGYHFHYKMKGEVQTLETDLIVMAIGWLANAEGLNLASAGVEINDRGYIAVNEYLQTSASNIFAAGDINGQAMLVPSSAQEGYYAASNAVKGLKNRLNLDLVPMGSFTDPEYAIIGLTETRAHEQKYDYVVSTIRFDEFPRSIIDGRTTGFCKLIVDRQTHLILGCHVVGERAVETVQMIAVGMKAGITIEQLAYIPLSFPTYVAIVGWAAADIAEQLGLDKDRNRWEPHRLMI